MAIIVLNLTLFATPSHAFIPEEPFVPTHELQCLAQGIYFEAKGEPLLGQMAVGHVILNRTKDERFPSTVCGVVQQTKHGCQFSWYCDGKSDALPNNDQAQLARRLAYTLLTNNTYDITKGALFFHADYVKPGWKKHAELTLEIGNHLFYRRP
jgi:spore germination cell wall hydrolase CwlJ-like protein